MTAEEIFIKLQASFPGLVKSEERIKDYPTWTVPAQSVRTVCEQLRSGFSFNYLDFITAVDWPGSVGNTVPPAAGRDVFELVYLISALSTGVKICLRCEISRKEPAFIPSLYGVFMAADWQEREVYDLFGIHFEGHPNLKRILTPETQLGYPLRKDYAHVPDSYD